MLLRQYDQVMDNNNNDPTTNNNINMYNNGKCSLPFKIKKGQI